MSSKVRDLDTIVFGKEDIDLSAVEQLVEVGQLKAIAAAMLYIQQEYLAETGIPEVLDRIMADIEAGGFDRITAFPQGILVMFRRFELAAAINRWRSLQLKNRFNSS